MTGQFVISLDFELLWGVRDHADHASYGANVLGGRKAIPYILDLFAKYEISATWATVGFLFCENRDELMDILPAPELRPNYDNKVLSNYSYLFEVGADEAADPYYFAPSLIRQITDTPRQEIASHTLSHFYCLEDGASEVAFEADLIAALTLANRRGIQLRSIVFPRNQYQSKHLAICRKLGIENYRGSPLAWAYRPTKGADQTSLRRALRLADAHTGVLGHQTYLAEQGMFRNVPASQFLRPCSRRLAPFHPAHIRNIKAGITKAARKNKGYHLWWHPHNFGGDTNANLKSLESILVAFTKAQQEYGMQSSSMADKICE